MDGWIATGPRGESTPWTSAALIMPEPWVAGALCAQTDPEAFFPEKGGNGQAAKAVCGRCDVREQCLEYALRIGATEGIWGGTGPKKRARMLAARRPARVSRSA